MRKAVTLPKGANSRELVVSPNGHTLLFSQAEQVESDIMVVENFR